MVNFLEGWKCPYCRKVYKKEYEAKDCAQECVDIESPICCNIVSCEVCECISNNDKDAENCELKHKEANDLKYQAYVVKKNFDMLKKAGEHRSQKKIEVF
jgi:hypothetical protein